MELPIMRALPFTLRQLEVFSDLAETRSFRGTADRLGISQASVSNQLRCLEQQLGVRLLDRRPGKRPVLTVQGHAFLSDLAAFEIAARRLAGHRRQTVEETRSVLFRVHAGQGLMDFYIRPKLDGFLAEHSNIELEFDTRPPSDRMARELPGSRFDFALFHLRGDRHQGHGVELLGSVDGGIYGHRDFAGADSLPLSPERVSAMPFILPRSGSEMERLALESFATFGIDPRHVVAHTQYFDVMSTMMERGLGVASFSAAILPPDLRTQVVRLMPLIDWRLAIYRAQTDADPLRLAVEHFLLSSVVLDPDYPIFEIVSPDWKAARMQVIGR